MIAAYHSALTPVIRPNWFTNILIITHVNVDAIVLLSAKKWVSEHKRYPVYAIDSLLARVLKNFSRFNFLRSLQFCILSVLS